MITKTNNFTIEDCITILKMIDDQDIDTYWMNRAIRELTFIYKDLVESAAKVNQAYDE